MIGSRKMGRIICRNVCEIYVHPFFAMWNLNEMYLLKIRRPHRLKRYVNCLNSVVCFEPWQFPTCKYHMQKYRGNHHEQNCVADAAYLKYYVWLDPVPVPPACLHQRIFVIKICQCQALKRLSKEYCLNSTDLRAGGSVLRRPVGESCGKERLRDPAFLMHLPVLVAMQVLAELQPHTDSSTRPFKGRLVFPAQWLHSCHADRQTWWYGGGTPVYPFKSLHTARDTLAPKGHLHTT